MRENLAQFSGFIGPIITSSDIVIMFVLVTMDTQNCYIIRVFILPRLQPRDIAFVVNLDGYSRMILPATLTASAKYLQNHAPIHLPLRSFQ